MNVKNFKIKAIIWGLFYAFLISIIVGPLLGVFVIGNLFRHETGLNQGITLSEYLQQPATNFTLLLSLITVFVGLIVGVYKTYILSENNKETWHIVILVILFILINQIFGSLLKINLTVPIWFFYAELTATLLAVLLGVYIGKLMKNKKHL